MPTIPIAPRTARGIVRCGSRWDQALHQKLKRDAKGEISDFEVDPAMVEQFQTEAAAIIKPHVERGDMLAIVTLPELRPFVRMMLERSLPNVPVLSTLEIARCRSVVTLGSLA